MCHCLWDRGTSFFTSNLLIASDQWGCHYILQCHPFVLSTLSRSLVHTVVVDSSTYISGISLSVFHPGLFLLPSLSGLSLVSPSLFLVAKSPCSPPERHVSRSSQSCGSFSITPFTTSKENLPVLNTRIICPGTSYGICTHVRRAHTCTYTLPIRGLHGSTQTQLRGIRLGSRAGPDSDRILNSHVSLSDLI